MRRVAPLLLGLLGLVPAADLPLPASTCTDTCYRTKSVEYQRCRIIPVASRAARVACFQRADAALQRCLRSCH